MTQLQLIVLYYVIVNDSERRIFPANKLTFTCTRANSRLMSNMCESDWRMRGRENCIISVGRARRSSIAFIIHDVELFWPRLIAVAATELDPSITTSAGPSFFPADFVIIKGKSKGRVTRHPASGEHVFVLVSCLPTGRRCRNGWKCLVFWSRIQLQLQLQRCRFTCAQKLTYS